MGSVNKVQILGNLGKDPEWKEFGNGNGVCNLVVATSERWKDKSGEMQEKTNWHNVSVFGKAGQNCVEYLSKGRQVFVSGSIQYRTYDKDGETRYATEIKADPGGVTFIGKGEKSGGNDTGRRGGGRRSRRDDPDDLPF